MSSEAITRNDLTAILNEVLPPTPSEYKKLLWSNPSPSSGFNAQTISLDLSDYDEVEIECLGSSGGSDFASRRCVVGKEVMVSYLGGGNGYGSGTPFLAERKFKVTTSGVEALAGLGTFVDSSAWSYNSNTRVIPWKIYGIKNERVYPSQFDAQIVHSVYDGVSTLQVNGGTYYNLFTLEKGIWIILLTFFTYSGDVVLCYGSSINNVISENGNSNAANGHSGAGVISLSAQTVIQMYVTDNTTLYRFKADAVKIA